MSFADNGNGTATLSGTPTVSGAFPFTITANNGVGSPATQSFTLTVDAAPAITSASSHHIHRGQRRQLHRHLDRQPHRRLCRRAGRFPPG